MSPIRTCILLSRCFSSAEEGKGSFLSPTLLNHLITYYKKINSYRYKIYFKRCTNCRLPRFLFLASTDLKLPSPYCKVPKLLLSLFVAICLNSSKSLQTAAIHKYTLSTTIVNHNAVLKTPKSPIQRLPYPSWLQQPLLQVHSPKDHDKPLRSRGSPGIAVGGGCVVEAGTRACGPRCPPMKTWAPMQDCVLRREGPRAPAVPPFTLLPLPLQTLESGWVTVAVLSVLLCLWGLCYWPALLALESSLPGPDSPIL